MEVIIKGKKYIPIMPPCIERTLDESFDRAHIVLKYIEVAEPFEPYTSACVDGERWLVAQDTVTESVGAGIKRFTHDIILVEETIVLTVMLSSAKTFTQALRVIDPTNQQPAPYITTKFGLNETSPIYTFVNPFQTPYFISSSLSITIPSILSLIKVPQMYEVTEYTGNQAQYGILVTRDGEIVTSLSKTFALTNGTTIYPTQNTTLGYYKIKYAFNTAIMGGSGSPAPTPHELTFSFDVLPALGMPPKYTITDVVKKLLSTVTPLRYGESPNITFDTVQSAKYSTVTAPEFSFANGQSLWETLLEVGKVIHGIPRLVNGVLKFDLLGGTEYATINGEHIANTEAVTMDRYCSAIEGIVDNVVSESKTSGSIRDPAYITLRATTEQVRINEETGIIQTLYPIEQIVSVKCGYKQGNNARVEVGDITEYIFEKTLYNLMSFYGETANGAKAFALYYEQGSRNIGGLFFKQPNVVSSAFEQYAIANIIQKKTGKNIFALWENNKIYYCNLDFEVTYIPIISIRARQHKADTGYNQAVIAYNQTADKVSSALLGRAMRSQVAMMTNSDKSLTYRFKSLADVPMCGTLYDDKYYINRTATEIYPNDVKCTISLQANYNRISQYVSMPNRLRQFEVSEKNVYDRHILYEDYCVLGDLQGNNNALLTDIGRGFVATALDNQSNFKPMQTAIVTMLNDTQNEDMYKIAYSCVLPLIGVPFGNSLLWSFAFEDNYSAGRKSERADTGANGYRVQNYVPYTDYYGRGEYMQIGFYNYITALSGSATEVGHTLPALPMEGITRGALLATTANHPILVYKDGRERLLFTYQLHFVTNRDDIIIGEDFSGIMSLVAETGVTGKARIYSYNTRINQFTGTTNTSGWSAALVFGQANGVHYIDCDAPVNGTSWAIIKDGKFMLGGNGRFKRIYFNFRHLPKDDIVYSKDNPYQEYPEDNNEPPDENAPSEPGFLITYNIYNINLTNMQPSILPGASYTTDLYTTGVYEVPDSVVIRVSGTVISSGYTYTKTSDTTATLTIPETTIIGNLNITAIGVDSSGILVDLEVEAGNPDIDGKLYVKVGNVEHEVEESGNLVLSIASGTTVQFIWQSTTYYTTLRFVEPDGDKFISLVPISGVAMYSYTVQAGIIVEHSETPLSTTRNLYIYGTEEGSNFDAAEITLGIFYGDMEVQHTLDENTVGQSGIAFGLIPNGSRIKFYWPPANDGYATIAVNNDSTGSLNHYNISYSNPELQLTINGNWSVTIVTYHN